MVDNAKDMGSRIGEDVDQGNISSAARRVKDTAAEYGQQGYDYATEKSRQMKEYTEGYVKENPWYAVGIALGVGLLLGILLRGGRD